MFLCINPLSQLLEFLLEVNECPAAPPIYRYDIDATEDTEVKEEDRKTFSWYDNDASRAALEEARAEVIAGQMSPTDYAALEEEIMRTGKPLKALVSLEKLPHTSLEAVNGSLPPHLEAATALTYLTSAQEDDYLAAIDASHNLALSSKTLMAKPNDKSNSLDREIAARNPVSVYNWLRKHKPEVFLQDNEAASEKSAAKPANPRSTKKSKDEKPVKQEPEMYDEDGIALAPVDPTPAKGKRKRDDDAYRPKGGSSRPYTKRKRGSVGGKGKGKAGATGE